MKSEHLEKEINEVLETISNYKNSNQITDDDLGSILRYLDLISADFASATSHKDSMGLFGPMFEDLINHFGKERCQNAYIKMRGK